MYKINWRNLSKFHFPALFMILVLLINVSVGQSELAEDTKGEPNLERHTSSLIEEVLLENSLLKSKENQIFVAALMIDLLWSRDEKLARQIAREAAEKIRAELSPNKETISSYRSLSLNYGELRQDLILTLVEHDSAFASEIKRYTLPSILEFPPTEKSGQKTLQNWTNDERELEQNMAFRVAAKNSAQAKKMASESLSKGVSEISLNTLRRFQIRDAAAADSFADELIEKLLASDFANDKEAKDTTSTFISQMNENSGVFNRILDCECPKPLNIDSRKFHKLASKWLNFMLTQKDEKISSDFLSAMPVLQKRLPERISDIKNKFNSIKKSQPDRVERRQLAEKFFDEKTAPETIAEAGLNKSEEVRFDYYKKAFNKATNHSKAALEKLLAAVSKHPESEEKNWIIDRIYTHLAGKTADEGNLDTAFEMSRKIVKKDSRLGFLTFLARKYQEKGETGKAKQLTDEIAALLDLNHRDNLPKSIVGYDIFSPVFQTYAVVDTERAFFLLEYVLPEANDYFSDKYRRANYAETIDLKTLIKRSDFLLPFYSKPIKNLTETDFMRLKKLTFYLNESELSVIAKVLLLQSLIRGKLYYKNAEDRRDMIILKN